MHKVMNWDYLNQHPELVAKVRKLAANEGRHANWYTVKFLMLLYYLPDDVRDAFQFIYREDHDIYNAIEFIKWIKEREKQ